MLNILKMAWRNVWRNWRRSGITIAAMTLALMAELLYSGLVAGLVVGMEEDATEFDLGDVQIFRTGYLTRPSLYNAVENDEAILQRLADAGYPATGRLFSGGLAASGDQSAGVGFIGLDPQADATALALHKAVAQGHWLDKSDADGVVIGRGLARILGVELESEIVVLSQASDGSIANDLFHVRGILSSVAAGMDRGTILMTDDAFRELMAWPTGVHKIIVKRPPHVGLEEARATIASLAGVTEDGDLEAKTWRELNPFLAQYLESVSSVIVIVYFIVYVAVAILILNAMLMAVFERIREFGVLKAIGYGPMHVLAMMLVEGLIQAVVATGLGLVFAAPLMAYLAVYGVNVGVLGGIQMAGMTMPPVWYGVYSLEGMLVPIGMLFFIVMIAVMWPAAKAAWISPVQAMRHQ